MPDISINTSFGHIRFAYQTKEELETTLKEIPSHVALVEQLTKGIVPRAPRSPKPGLEGIYGFTPSGQVDLYRSPTNLNQIVALALFCYSPDTVSEVEIEQVTGISKVVTRVIGQTNNKKYYRNIDGKYGLTPEGAKLVSRIVLPKLETPGKTTEEKESTEGE